MLFGKDGEQRATTEICDIRRFVPQVNIPLSSLGEPVLMGVALNHTSAGRPSAEFYVRYSFLHFKSLNPSQGGVTKSYSGYLIQWETIEILLTRLYVTIPV